MLLTSGNLTLELSPIINEFDDLYRFLNKITKMLKKDLLGTLHDYADVIQGMVLYSTGFVTFHLFVKFIYVISQHILIEIWIHFWCIMNNLSNSVCVLVKRIHLYVAQFRHTRNSWISITSRKLNSYLTYGSTSPSI